MMLVIFKYVSFIMIELTIKQTTPIQSIRLIFYSVQAIGELDLTRTIIVVEVIRIVVPTTNRRYESSESIRRLCLR
jgi:hypothetical protein